MNFKLIFKPDFRKRSFVSKTLFSQVYNFQYLTKRNMPIEDLHHADYKENENSICNIVMYEGGIKNC